MNVGDFKNIIPRIQVHRRCSHVKNLPVFSSLGCRKVSLQCWRHFLNFVTQHKSVLRLEARKTTNNLCEIRTLNFMTSRVPLSARPWLPLVYVVLIRGDRSSRQQNSHIRKAIGLLQWQRRDKRTYKVIYRVGTCRWFLYARF